MSSQKHLTIKLNDGKSIPALAWGNGTGGINATSDKAVETGVQALKAGIVHIDTAQVYRTEKEAGVAIEQAGFKKDDIWVTTKISGNSNTKTDADDIRRSVKESLDKLGFIPDMILVHSPFISDVNRLDEFWTFLEDLVLDGTLKGCSLGVSNFRPQDLDKVLKVARIKPAVNQLEYHPYVLTHLQPVIDYHAKHGIVIESYGPLSPLLRHPTGGPVKPILERVAKRLSDESGQEVDSAMVLLLWTMQMGVVAVTTSGNPENIKKMVRVESLPKLNDSEIKEIEEAGRKVHFRAYDEHMSKDFPAPDLPKDL